MSDSADPPAPTARAVAAGGTANGPEPEGPPAGPEEVSALLDAPASEWIGAAAGDEMPSRGGASISDAIYIISYVLRNPNVYYLRHVQYS